MVEYLLMIQWVVGSIPHSRLTELMTGLTKTMTGLTKAVLCAIMCKKGPAAN